MKQGKRYHYLILLALVVAPIIVYANSLGNGFVYDDITIIVNNEEIRDWHNIFTQFTPYRQMRWISFTLDYALWELNPFGYHLSNLMFHIICTLLVYGFICAAFKNRALAAITALLFATHPVLTETVNNISNRNDLLATLFLLASVMFYVRERRTFAMYGLSVVFFVLSLLSKEAVAVAAPALIVAFDFCFSSERGIVRLIKRKVKYYVPYAVILLAFMALVLKASTFRTIERVSDVAERMGATADAPELSFAAVFGTWARAITTYIKLLVYPRDLCADYPFPSVSSLGESRVVVSLIALLVFMTIMIRLYRYSRTASYGLLWILIMLIPVSNIVPLTAHFVAERYLYAPAVGFCLFLGVIIRWIYAGERALISPTDKKKLAIGILAVVLAVYGVLAVQRNYDWKSNYTLWSKTLSQKPESFTGRSNLALEYQNSGRIDRAIVEYRRALQIKPHSALMYYNIGTCYAQKERFEKAIESLEKAIQTDPGMVMAYYQLGTVLLLEGSFEEGVRTLRRAIEIAPRFADAYYTLALAYQSRGLRDDALGAFRKAVEIDPKFARTPYGLRSP